MIIVMVIPTGIGADIGGHAGDGNPVAKLIASTCDTLITHPNVLNASDINEMTENTLYVEGSMLDKFLEGRIGLEKVYINKILLVVNALTNEIQNAANAAKVTIGSHIDIVELKKPLRMVAKINSSGMATGDIFNLEEMVGQISKHKHDVIIVNTPIDTEDNKVMEYLSNDGGVNVWGGVEAMLSKLASDRLGRPVFHAPVENSEVFKNFNEVVDPRKAAEIVSMCYIHCCFKGAHKAPKISLKNMAYWNTDIDFLVTPANVFGRPHRACVNAGIKVIAVKENKTVLNDQMPEEFIIVDSYLEAVGVISAMKAGVSLDSIRRPIEHTQVLDKINHIRGIS